jgi:hypothetical protein
MSNYRRARLPGATYSFTVNLRDRSSDLLVREIDLLRNNWGQTTINRRTSIVLATYFAVTASYLIRYAHPSGQPTAVTPLAAYLFARAESHQRDRFAGSESGQR